MGTASFKLCDPFLCKVSSSERVSRTHAEHRKSALKQCLLCIVSELSAAGVEKHLTSKKQLDVREFCRNLIPDFLKACCAHDHKIVGTELSRLSCWHSHY